MTLEELEARAKAMGFVDLADMLAAHEEVHQQITAPGGPADLTQAEVDAGIAYDDHHVMIPIAAYRGMMEQAGVGGRAAYEAEVAPRLAALGFKDLADLIQTVERKAANPTPQEQPNVTTPANPTAPTGAQPPAAQRPGIATPPAAQAAPAGDDPASERRLPPAVRQRLAAIRDQSRQEVARATAAKDAAERQVQQANAALAAEQQASQMKIAMVRAGVKDIDYAWFKLSTELGQLRRDAETMPEAKEKLAKFDVAPWVDELRKSTPYVFGEQPVPATTPSGAAAGGAPAPGAPTTGGVTGATAAAGAFDARRASPEDFQKRMSELGISYSGQAPPMRP